MKSLRQKTNKALVILFSILLLAGLALIFQLAKANFIPSMNFGGKPQIAYPPPENTPMDFFRPTSTALPSPTVTPTPIVLENGWYLYEDPDSDFSFSYPPTAIISSGMNSRDFSKNITVQFKLPGKSYQGMTFRLEKNPKLLSGVEIAIKVLEDSSGKTAPTEFSNTLEYIEVGGKQAIQASVPETNTETTIIVPLGEKFMIIAPVHDTAVIKVEPEILKIFFEIIDTIKFNDVK